MVISGGGDQTVQVWDLATGVPVGDPFTGHTGAVLAVAVAELAGRPVSALSEADDRALRMSELAATANSSMSRLSHVVSRLETRGWVRREPCPGDGRFINAVLTDEGWQKVLATAPGHVAAVRELLVKTLTEEEFRQLGAISARVLAAQGIKVIIPNEPG